MRTRRWPVSPAVLYPAAVLIAAGLAALTWLGLASMNTSGTAATVAAASSEEPTGQTPDPLAHDLAELGAPVDEPSPKPSEELP